MFYRGRKVSVLPIRCAGEVTTHLVQCTSTEERGGEQVRTRSARIPRSRTNQAPRRHPEGIMPRRDRCRDRAVVLIRSECRFCGVLTPPTNNPTFLQAYGEAGVVKIVKILEREIVYGMQLLGAPTVRDLVPEMVSSAVPNHGSKAS